MVLVGPGVAAAAETVYIRPPNSPSNSPIEEDQMPDQTGPTSSRRRVVAGAGIVGLAITTLTSAVFAQVVAPLAGPSPATQTADRFIPYLDQDFLIWNDQVRLMLKLVEVRRLPRGLRPVNLPDPFSLVFSGWHPGEIDAGIYQVQDADGKRAAIFLHPVTSGPLYEAAFN
jgi:hypothetical protein